MSIPERYKYKTTHLRLNLPSFRDNLVRGEFEGNETPGSPILGKHQVRNKIRSKPLRRTIYNSEVWIFPLSLLIQKKHEFK